MSDFVARGGGRIRRRLLVAFLLVALPPLVVLGISATALIEGRFETTTRARFEAGLRRVQAQIDARRRRAEQQVAAVVREMSDLRPGADEPDRVVAEKLAASRDLAALVLVDMQGRVVSSSHWPAGFNLPETGLALPGDQAFRIEKVAEDYGAAERLALLAASPAVWRGAPVTVRGGSFVDREFLTEISGLMDLDVALRSSTPARWFTRPGSPLEGWGDPGFAGAEASGSIRLGGASYRFAAAPLSPSLWLVLGTPSTETEQVTRDLRRAALALAGVAMIAAIAAAFAVSGRIARPVRELAQAARRVAAGDLSGSSVQTLPPADEVGDLARAFEAMTRDLRASRERIVQAERVAAWREMAQRLAHELKNPLFPIQLSIETLRRAFEQERSPEGPSGNGGFAALFRDSSDTILQELQSLKGIIEEFSQFARMPPPRIRPTDVNAVVEQVVSLYQARAAEVRVERVLGDALPLVPADPELLARALGNLVANALDAMPQGGTLRVRTTSQGAFVAIAVEDSGLGLTDDQRTRLFTPHFTTKKGGTGLGLAIVQGIVSDHGGRVEVESARGLGTRFSLVLPTAVARPSGGS